MELIKKYLKLHLKCKLQYKKSLILEIISQFFIFFTYYFTILALFGKFSNVKGFTMYEVLISFSIIQIGYSLVETFGRGIDKFDELIKNGNYDLLRLRPVSIAIQIFGYKIDYIKLTRTFQGFIILIIALVNLKIKWNIFRVICLLLMIVSSCLVFLGIFIIAAAYCFITVEGLEIRNLFTDGGKHMAQYPIGIFKRGFVFIFTFIIPYGFVNYYPLLYLLGRNNNILYAFSPLLLFIFLIPCIYIFNRLSKRYISAMG